ncbi:hypothetical protein GCM10029963_24850 [Micromonospora andamanensis]|uniref:hypothetical protein n=1 Tax=Micromonospora andamanensis TaxID=1287068 RepID=UPI001950EEAF|nr:hypothetical protein [Micromonospora andamanensis]GIJ41990.1 hypothetical protein Vwe01_53150 [Micromonospora andamanensis]
MTSASAEACEVVAFNLDDIRLSARKELIIVRSGKGNKYREVPVHEQAQLRTDLKLWIENERPDWTGAANREAPLLNHRGGRVSARGATACPPKPTESAPPTASQWTAYQQSHTSIAGFRRTPVGPLVVSPQRNELGNQVGQPRHAETAVDRDPADRRLTLTHASQWASR